MPSTIIICTLTQLPRSSAFQYLKCRKLGTYMSFSILFVVCIYQEKFFFAVQRLDMARPFRDSIIALCLALIFQNMLKNFHYLQLYTCNCPTSDRKKPLIRHLSKQGVISIFVPIIKMFWHVYLLLPEWAKIWK